MAGDTQGTRERFLGRPLRTGFALGLGLLLAFALAKSVLATAQVLILVLVAGFLAIGLNPLVDTLSKRMRRGVAVMLVLLAGLGFVGGFAAAAVPPIVSQTRSLIDETPDYLDKLQRQDNPVGRFVAEHNLKEKAAEKVNNPDLAFTALGGVFGVGMAILGFLVSTLTVTVLTCYFLANFPDIRRFGIALIPASKRSRAEPLIDEVLSRVGGYVLGNLATSLVCGLAAWIFLSIAGVPYAVALAMLLAILDLIPLVGATIGAVAVTAVAFFTSLWVGVATLIYTLAYQQFENYILQPRVMKRAVDVPPVVTIVAALIGSALLGIIGALLAIPVAAAIQLFMQEVVLPRQERS